MFLYNRKLTLWVTVKCENLKKSFDIPINSLFLIDLITQLVVYDVAINHHSLYEMKY